jgi:hypothetical protein
MASRRPHLWCGLFAARISVNHLLFHDSACAKNRRNQGPFWSRNPFNVLLKIALPDVGRISTVLRLRRPRKAVRDEEPKNKRREYASRIVRKTSVFITNVMNAVQYCFVFCSLVGVEIGIAGKGSNSAARRKGNAISSRTDQWGDVG